jgi:hypothetical protein
MLHPFIDKVRTFVRPYPRVILEIGAVRFVHVSRSWLSHLEVLKMQTVGIRPANPGVSART